MLIRNYSQLIGEKIMSLVHLRLSQIINNDEFASYKIESTDFSAQKEWEELGSLNISKINKNYNFIATQLAKDNKLIHPELYKLSKELRQSELDDKFSDYGWGAWSMCIHHWAHILIINNHYPKYYPV